MHITSRLRDHFFRDAFPSMDHHFPDQPPPFPSYGGRDISPPGMHSNLGPPFHKFDAFGGMPPHGGFQPHDDRPPFMHNIHRPGMPHNISERNPSSAWGPQVSILHYLTRKTFSFYSCSVYWIPKLSSWVFRWGFCRNIF